MHVVEKVLDGGIVEKRFYDEDNKLVDIRKIYPPSVVNSPFHVRRTPGTAGGHEH